MSLTVYGTDYGQRIYLCLRHCPHYKWRIPHHQHTSFRSLVLKLSQRSCFEPPLGRRAHIYHFLNLVFLFGYNPLSGRSVKEFVEACKTATGVDIKVDFLPRRPGDYAEVFSNPSKILRELNWTAHYTDLRESLQIAWRWQKSHLNGYGPALNSA